MRKTKRLCSLLLAIALLLACMPQIPLTAEAATASGTCGDNLTWSLNSSGTLTISGTGAMFFLSNPWYSYKADIKKVIINYGATTIASEAFSNCASLSSVTLPNSITEIKSRAFQSCTSLTSITIPDSVIKIGNGAFRYCTSLSNIKLGESVSVFGDVIGGNVFYECTSLTSITIPASVTDLRSGTFDRCKNLKTIYFDGSAPSMSSYLFDGVTATAYYYPDETWTKAFETYDFDGNITWVSRGCKHSYSSTVTQPTCTAQGYTTHRCTKCGSSYKDSYTSAKGHSYGTWTKLNDTSHSRTCTVCKKVSETANHSWNSGVVTSQETCKEAGIKTYTCSVCKGTKTETIPATGDHSYTSVVTPPTCTEQGFTTHTCSKCGDSYKDTYTDAKEHSYSSVVTPPTCKEQGYTTHTCRKCGDSYKDTYVDAKGHSYTDWESTDDTNHKRFCTECPDGLEIAHHMWNPGFIIKPATCTEDAVKNYRCIYCQATRDETVADSALGHKYDDWEQVDETYHKHTCTECTTHSESAKHTFGEDRVCTGCGYKAYTVGDFDGDDLVTDADVIWLLWYTVFPEDYPLNQSGDFDGDGLVTDADVIYLLWHTVFPEDYPLE